MILHHFRKDSKSLTTEEALEQVTNKLNECGIEMQAQAQFDYEVACLIVGNDNPKFISLQPIAKLPENKAWIMAYEYILSFLSLHQMTTTIATMDVELYNKELPRRDTFVKISMLNLYFANLISSHTRKSFSNRVSEFCRVEGLSHTEPEKESRVIKPKKIQYYNKMHEYLISMQKSDHHEIFEEEEEEEEFFEND